MAGLRQERQAFSSISFYNINLHFSCANYSLSLTCLT
jgi:hypothetical protein